MIVKDIQSTQKLDEKIIRAQKRIWLRFNCRVPEFDQMIVSSMVKKETGREIKWLSDNEIVIELLGKSESLDTQYQKKQNLTSGKHYSSCPKRESRSRRRKKGCKSDILDISNDRQKDKNH